VVEHLPGERAPPESLVYNRREPAPMSERTPLDTIEKALSDLLVRVNRPF
jgi:hypothetical protein